MDRWRMSLISSPAEFDRAAETLLRAVDAAGDDARATDVQMLGYVRSRAQFPRPDTVSFYATPECGCVARVERVFAPHLFGDKVSLCVAAPADSGGAAAYRAGAASLLDALGGVDAVVGGSCALFLVGCCAAELQPFWSKLLAHTARVLTPHECVWYLEKPAEDSADDPYQAVADFGDDLVLDTLTMNDSALVNEHWYGVARLEACDAR